MLALISKTIERGSLAPPEPLRTQPILAGLDLRPAASFHPLPHPPYA